MFRRHIKRHQYMAFHMVSSAKKSLLPRHGGKKGRWSKDDIKVLKGMAPKEPLSKIAKSLKRTEDATRRKATLLGVSLRMTPKKRAASAMTQPADRPVKAVGLRGGGLVAVFVDDKGFVSADRVAKRFGMSKVQLAETIGVKPETVYRATRLMAPKTQTRTTEMLEILGRVVDWAGGEKQAMAWYRAEPIAAFGGRTAESLVKEGRSSAVRDYLDQVATGGFA
jgi:uncharacterized protein (DUF2384 family)